MESNSEAKPSPEAYSKLAVVDGSIAPRMDRAQVNRMKESGVTVVNWTVALPQHALADFLCDMSEGHEALREFDDEITLVRTVADIREAKANGKVGIIIGPQNAMPAQYNLRLLSSFYALGIRILQLTYNDRNQFGDGAAEPANAGLSVQGIEAVREMNRLGIVIDLSHCGDRTTEEAIDTSESPILFTHANARALHPSPRNKTDGQIKSMAERGGVIGLSMWSPMLRFDRRPTLNDFLDHVSYVADLVGCEHVGIGTDHNESADRDEWTRNSSRGEGRYQSVTGQMGDWYVYETRCAEGASSITDFPYIYEGLVSRGFSGSEIEGIMGENFIRVFGQVWSP